MLLGWSPEQPVLLQWSPEQPDLVNKQPEGSSSPSSKARLPEFTKCDPRAAVLRPRGGPRGSLPPCSAEELEP